MLKFLSSIWNRVRSFFRRILNYGNHNNAEHKNTHSTNTFKTDNSNVGKNMDNGQLTIYEAIEQNHWKEALELINQAQPDELNATNELGQTPLHLAVAAKRLGTIFNSTRDDIINALIKKGANVNAQDKDGETALGHILKSERYAARKAINTIETLLEKGARVKNQEQALKVIEGSILHSKDSLKMIKLVTSQPAFKVNYKDKEGNSALSLAYKRKKFDVVKFLIEKGADPKTIIPSTGKSFITHVIEDNLFDLVPSLKFDVVLENDLSPLAMVVHSNKYDSVKLLIEKYKVDINFSDRFGRKAIHYAAAGGNTEIVEYLISHGADVNSLDEHGNTALHYAAGNKDGNENIAFLIKKGIGVNCEDSSGVRPIRLAIARNNLNNFQTLLNNGASLEPVLKEIK